MKEEELRNSETFTIYPVGYVRRSEETIRLEILEPFRPALKQLDHFSHVIVFWWADRRDTRRYRARMQTKPPYARDKLTGVFACRAEYRPNPIGMTVVRLIERDGITLRVAGLDAFDGTPVLDLKPYIPRASRPWAGPSSVSNPALSIASRKKDHFLPPPWGKKNTPRSLQLLAKVSRS